MAAVVDLAGVSIVRGGATLIDDLTWRVDESDRWVVIGPNGAGKTTLLQIVAAQIHPSSGVAGLLGEVLGTVDVFELRPRIGLTSAALAERIPRGERVHDVVVSASYAVIGRWREDYDELDHVRADELLASLGIASLADRTFGTLSEGERKRVQIARALMTDPELLLLDEPAAGLDLSGRESLVRTLGDLARDPYAPASVLVTHHVEEIPVGITHALLLRRGRVVAAGPLDETPDGGEPEGDLRPRAGSHRDRRSMGRAALCALADGHRRSAADTSSRRSLTDVLEWHDGGVNLTDWLGENAWAHLAGPRVPAGGRRDHVARPGADHARRRALAGAVTAGLAPGVWWLQIGVAIIVSIGMLLLLRPTLMRRVRNMPGYRSSTAKMVGSTGVATTRDHQGRRRDQGRRPDLDGPSVRPQHGDRAGHRDRGVRDRRRDRCRLPGTRTSSLMHWIARAYPTYEKC